MFRARFVQFVALLGAVALVAGAALWIPRINAGRKQLTQFGSESPLANAPPEYAFYIQALGAFRGIIADIAFIRAESLKQEGRFYDAMQLHEWICTLQPRFPAVWEFAAWNMAWNISVTTFTAEERWNWVYNGVRLLRDRGVPMNPRAVNLYKQLAWIYNNKMSEGTDEYNFAYKREWAWRMHLLLGPPPQPLELVDPAEVADNIRSSEDLDQLIEAGHLTQAAWEGQQPDRKKSATPTTQPGTPQAGPPRLEAQFLVAQAAAAAQIRPILDAPSTLAGLYESHPAARGMVADLRTLGVEISDSPLDEDSYWNPTGLAFTFFWPYREHDLSNAAEVTLRRRDPNAAPAAPADRGAQIARILGLAGRNGPNSRAAAGNADPARRATGGQPAAGGDGAAQAEISAAGEALLRLLQRKVLLEVYKLDPKYMLEVIDTFGPVDWRAVDAHSLYWVMRGLVAAGGSVSEYGNDKTNTLRIVFFSLRNLFLRNRMVFEPDPQAISQSALNLSPDVNFVRPLNEAYVKYGALFDPGTYGRDPGDIYRAGHVNLLSEAIRWLYLTGRDEDARWYYDFLRRTYPMTFDGQPNQRWSKTLRQFVMDDLASSLEVAGPREIMLLLDALFMQSLDALARGDLRTFSRILGTARERHESYQRDKRNDPAAARLLVPEFDQLVIDAFGLALVQPAVARGATVYKSRLWRRAPLMLRQSVYDYLRERLVSECEAWGFDPNLAFPEPLGMDVYRQRHPPPKPAEAGGASDGVDRSGAVESN